MLSRLLLCSSVREMRQQPMQRLLLLLGIMLGVAVVAAMLISTESARISYQRAAEQLSSGITHRIQSPQGIETRLYTKLRRAPEQWAVQPVVQFTVQLPNRSFAQVIGLDFLAAQRQSGQVRPDVEGEISWEQLLLEPVVWTGTRMAGQLGIKPGESVSVVTPQGEQSLVVAGVLDESDFPVAGQRLLMDIGQALALKGQAKRLSYLSLSLTDDQVAQLEAQLPSSVQLVALDTLKPQQLGDSLYFNLNAMSLLALLMGGMVVLSAVWLSLVQRKPLLAALRLSGVSAQQLMTWLLVEVTLIALVGALLGIALGILLADQLLPLLIRSQAAFSVPPLAQLHLTFTEICGLILLGVGSALGAAIYPCWQISQQSPLLLQHPPQVEVGKEQWSSLSVPIILLLLLALVTLRYGDTLLASYVAMALLAVASAIGLPFLLQLVATAVSKAMHLMGISHTRPLLAMVPRDCLRQQVYSKGVMLVLMLALAAAVAVNGMTASFHSAFQQWISQRLSAPIYISQSASLPGQRESLPEALFDQLEAQPGVTALDRRTRLPLAVEGYSLYLYGGDFPEAMRSGYRFRQGDAAAIWQRVNTEPVILISEPLANHLHLQQGDPLSLPTGQGVKRFEIAGVYYDYGSYQGQILIGMAQYSRFWRYEGARGVRVYLADDSRAQHIADLPWLQPYEVNLVGPILKRSEQLFEQTFLITDALQLLLLLVALVSMAANLLALQLFRKPELKRYRALGLSRMERAGLLLGQALLLAFSAGLVAWVLGELLAYLLAEWVQLQAFGWTIPWQFDPMRGALALIAGVAVALVAALYPAFQRRLYDEQ